MLDISLLINLQWTPLRLWLLKNTALFFRDTKPSCHLVADFPSFRSEVKARQDVKPDFRHPPFTDYRQPPVDYRHPPVTDYRQPPTLDYRHPPGLLDFRQHPAAAQFPLGIPADFRLQVDPEQRPICACLTVFPNLYADSITPRLINNFYCFFGVVNIRIC